MKNWSISSALLFVLCIGCGSLQPSDGSKTVASAGPVRDYKSLIAHLRDSGLRVEAAGEVEQPFFTPKAKVIRIGDTGEAQIYEYGSEEQAATEAARVSSNGSVGTSMPMWIAPPHFFRKQSLIVLYLGSDEQTLSTLREVLGSEFAGS